MIYKITITILLLNIHLFSQQIVLFNSPPGNITLPSVLVDENAPPKTSGMGIIESKWVQSSSASAESLLQTFSSSTEAGLRKMINDILIKANIPEEKTGKLMIKFTSSGIDERGIDKDSVKFSDDFAVKYPAENMLLITKLYRTRGAIIEITDAASSEFDPAIKNALSEGLRFGNKTESANENKMTIEIQNLEFAYEYQSFNISRTADKEIVVPLYYTTDIGLNSITNMSITEGAQYEYYVKVGSDILSKPVEFRISNVNPKTGFRIGGREAYTMTYIQMSGNKVTFSISGFSIIFP
jgi:hypothetical protein